MIKIDSKHEEIRRRVWDCYAIIKLAEDELKRIRNKECEHPEKSKKDYMWAPGHIKPDTLICIICGEVLE